MAYKVLILMGSDSDAPVMAEAAKALKEFGIEPRMTVASAHRTPERVKKLVGEAEADNYLAVICGAGWAAHLAGVVASETSLPVLAVPIASSSLQGLDALLATVQMPSGVPVAGFAIGDGGARNAGLFAVQMAARFDKDLAEKYRAYKASLAEKVEAKAKKVEEQYA